MAASRDVRESLLSSYTTTSGFSLNVDAAERAHTHTDAKKDGPALSWNVLLPILIAAVSNVLFGYENSNVSGAKVDFSNEYGIASSSAQYGFITSGMPVGACLGSVLAGLLQDRLGRRRSLILASTAYLGAAAVTVTAQGFAQLAAGRVATGVTIGVFSSTVPMYIAELSPPAVRGRLVTVNQLCICLGILLGYIACMFLTPNWRYVFAAGIPLAAVCVLCFTCVTPYSPRWLMSKGRKDEARAVLQSIRGDTDAAERELETIADTLAQSAREDPWARLREPALMWAVAIGVILSFIQQWTGCNAVNAYAPDILNAAGFSSTSSLQQSTYIGVSKLVMVAVALLVMDWYGRRTLLLMGTAGMAVSLALLAMALQIKLTWASPPSGMDYVAEVTLFLYMGFFEMSLGPVLWLLLSELYPLSVRGVAMSIGSTACWLFTFSVTQLFPIMRSGLTIYGVFYAFVGVALLACVWMWMYIPETRGKSLEEIEVMLKEGRTR